MADLHGSFIWYELLTGDADAAQDFYGKVLGWTFSDSGQADMDYRLFNAGSEMVGGLMALTDEMKSGGAQPGWLGYVGVDDTDAAVKKIVANGGAELMPAMDIPDVGRMAMIADPQGAPFYVMTPLPSDDGAVSTSFAAEAPMVGHCAWNELATSDPDAALEFYADQFGWTQDGDMDMGEMGTYRFLRHGDIMIGAVMPKMPQMPVSAWSYYFRVPDIDAAITTINTNGGSIVHGPIEIPGGEYALNAMDLQGAAFALVGPKL